ncbi:hypothetical protein P7C70_g3051, partial [Phenoliferia sp. Uapishka_3]
MLKRISFNKEPEPYLVPPSLQPQYNSVAPGSPRTPLPPSPSRSAPPSPSLQNQTQAGSYFPIQPTVDRPTLHRSLAALSNLLVALDEVRDLAGKTAKANKKVAKAQRELGATFGDKVENGARSDIVGAALLASAGMFENLSEVDGKHAKKEEKSFDETISALDGKVQKATQSYEKTRPRAQASSPAAAATAAAAHDKYITALSSLSTTIASVKKAYTESVGDQRQKSVREIARIMCSVADASWRSRVEATRRGGDKAGEVVARGVWCETGMPGLAPEEEEGEEVLPLNSPPATNGEHPRQEQDTSTQQPSMRGPRPLYTTTDSSYSLASNQTLQPDPAIFKSAPGLPSNTYLVQLAPPENYNQPIQKPSPHYSRPQSRVDSQHAQYDPSPPTPQRPTPLRSVSRNDTLYNEARSSSRNDTLYTEPRSSSRNDNLYDSDSLRTATNTGRESRSTRHTTVSNSPFSSEDGERHRNVSDPDTREREKIIAPRGFVLEEDEGPMSPVFEQEREEVRRERERAREREAEKQSAAPPPTTNISWAKDDRVAPKERVERQDSTASERNFVARMKEKYAEDKEKQQWPSGSVSGSSQRGEDSGAGWGPAKSRSEEKLDSQGHARSSSRVSSLAQRYNTNFSLPTGPTASSNPVRPVHRYTQSMQPLGNNGRYPEPSTTSSSGFNEFGQIGRRYHPNGDSSFGSEPPRTAPLPRSDERPYSRQSLPLLPPSNDSYRSAANENGSTEEEHPSSCACEKCTQANYGAKKDEPVPVSVGTVGKKSFWGGRR